MTKRSATSTHRVLGFTTLALGMVVALSATAFACTTWKGRFTVTVTGTAPGEGGQVVGWGANLPGQMMNCLPWEGTASTHAGGSGSHTDGHVTVAVAPAAGPLECDLSPTLSPNKLTAGTYNVNFLNTGFGDFVGIDPAREYKADCMTGGHRSTWELGEISVNSSGVGAGNFIVDKPSSAGTGQEVPDLPGTESAICVSGPATAGHVDKAQAAGEATEGMQNPITVI